MNAASVAFSLSVFAYLCKAATPVFCVFQKSLSFYLSVAGGWCQGVVLALPVPMNYYTLFGCK